MNSLAFCFAVDINDMYFVLSSVAYEWFVQVIEYWLVACSANATQADFALESQAAQQTILFAGTALD